ncbi:MAG: hypothetical protein L0196_03305 [candidate division Zixibacteria bacterium]|nr:hypothetical protein [candidate division Zixibacteria bacterium]
MTEPPVHVSRGASGSSHVSSLAPYETRLIAIAEGVQFRDSDLPEEVDRDYYRTFTGRKWRFPDFLREKVPGIVFTSDTRATYVSDVQGVRFNIEITTRKDEFKGYLQRPEIHVVYAGHARYGRGGCFGDQTVGEDWENGSNPTLTGLYRLGYTFIIIPAQEILEHGYTANLVRSSLALPREECHPDLRRVRGGLVRRTLDQLVPEINEYRRRERLRKTRVGIAVGPHDQPITAEELNRHVAGPVGSGEQFWSYPGRLGGHAGPHVVIRAGWTDTVSRPMDLGATNLQCRVYAHLGCSTFVHNYRILRFYKNWRRDGNERYAYWTTATAEIFVSRMWLYYILTYPRYNAHESWGPSLEYAVSKTNRILRNEGRHYRLI